MYNQLPLKKQERIFTKYRLSLKQESTVGELSGETNYVALLVNKEDPKKTIHIAKFILKISKIKIVIENINMNIIFNKAYKEYLFKVLIEYLQNRIRNFVRSPVLVVKTIDTAIVEVLIETSFSVDVVYTTKEPFYVGHWEK